MKIQHQLIVSLLGIACFFVPEVKAQQIYLAGTAREGIEPKPYPFSIALAGYGLPRGGRFSIEWIKKEDGNKSIFTSAAKLEQSWKKPEEDIISLTSYKGRVFALTKNDELLQYELNNKKGDWVKVAKFNGQSYNIHLKSIAISKGKLYGLDQNDVIFEGRHKTDGNLSVTALALAANKKTVIIVGADVCGFNHDFISSVKREIFKRHKIAPSAILINASHTHFAPSTQDWTTWGRHQMPDSAYLNGVLKPAMISAIERAIKNMQPSYLSFGRGKTAIGGNRSLKGTAVPYDNDVDVLHIERKNDHHKTIAFLTGCHPVFKNAGAESFTISANYPGITKATLEKEAGISEALFLQGCAGDIDPLSTDHIKTGKDLAADIKEVLNKPMEKLTGGISFYLDSLNFPVNRWSNERILAFRKENDKGNADVYAEKNVRWADLMLQFDKNNNMPEHMPVYLQTINIGNWKLVGLSREVVTDYSIGIKKIWPEKLVSVAGYCNDVSSYLPTSRHILAGTYEGLDSFFWYGQPSVFPLDVYEMIINKIKALNH